MALGRCCGSVTSNKEMTMTDKVFRGAVILPDRIIENGYACANRQGRLSDYLTRLDFIILDELGYLPFAQSWQTVAIAPDLLPLRASVFGDPRMTAALLDGLTHHCKVREGMKQNHTRATRIDTGDHPTRGFSSGVAERL